MTETQKQRFERLRPLTPAFIADGTLRKRISNKLTDEQCISAGRSVSEIGRAGGRARAKQMRTVGQQIPIYRRTQP